MPAQGGVNASEREHSRNPGLQVDKKHKPQRGVPNQSIELKLTYHPVHCLGSPRWGFGLTRYS